MITLAIGENSSWGKLKKLLQGDEKNEKTPLEEKLSILADQIGELGLKGAIATFGAMVLHLVIEIIVTGEPKLDFFSFIKHVLSFFIIAVTVVVVAVPEGLPLAVTIALAYSVGKMKDENNLVRYLAACETMGGANNICSDKTGTLTKNSMTVMNLYIEESDMS
jgi:Ca2+ transporting ATPase